MKILVVDDNPVQQKLLETQLGKKGHHVFLADGGHEALKHLEEHDDLQIVISKWLFTSFDVKALWRHVKKKHANRYIYVIIITANDCKEDVISALKSAADDYLLKPFNMEELSARIQVAGRIINFDRKHKRSLWESRMMNEQLEKANRELKQTHAQMLQQEKMASIGQLAAGVAHEINNPSGFVSSNLASLGKHVKRLLELISTYHEGLQRLTADGGLSAGALNDEIMALRKQLKFDFISEDILDILVESTDGMERIRKIVADLKSFSHVDQAEFKDDDINEGLERTLNVIQNELKYKCDIIREYGELPCIYCNMGQLNQVFMNLLLNAAQAIEDHGTVTITTRLIQDDSDRSKSHIEITIRDTGCGIPADILARVFDPFYTTKPVGVGTGLGLSIAYDIVKKHSGTMTVHSENGQGTSFVMLLPVRTAKDLTEGPPDFA